MKGKHYILKLGISIVISLSILWILLGLFDSQNNRPGVWRIFQQTSCISVVLYTVLTLFNTVIRALRFHLLIAVDKTSLVPSKFHICLITMVRNMLVDLLPARLGEFSYIAMMNRGCRVPGNLCVSSLSISFVFDFIALVLIIFFVTILQLLTKDLKDPIVEILIVVIIIVTVMALALFIGIKPSVRIARKALARFSHTKVMTITLTFLETVTEAIELTFREKVIFKVFLLSIAVRLIKYASLYILFKGVALESFVELSGISPIQILFVLISGEAGASLAIPTLMGFGTYEASSTIALTLFGFPPVASTIVTLVVHIWSQCIDYTIGGLAFMLFMFHVSKLKNNKSAEK